MLHICVCCKLLVRQVLLKGSNEMEIVECEFGTAGRDGLVTGYSTTAGRPVALGMKLNLTLHHVSSWQAEGQLLPD